MQHSGTWDTNLRKHRASSIMNNQRKYSQRSGKHGCIFFCHVLDWRCIIMTKARLVLPWTNYSFFPLSLSSIYFCYRFSLWSPLQKQSGSNVSFLASNINSVLTFIFMQVIWVFLNVNYVGNTRANMKHNKHNLKYEYQCKTLAY